MCARDIASVPDHATTVLKNCKRDGLRIEVIGLLAEALRQRCNSLRVTYDMEACV